MKIFNLFKKNRKPAPTENRPTFKPIPTDSIVGVRVGVIDSMMRQADREYFAGSRINERRSTK